MFLHLSSWLWKRIAPTIGNVGVRYYFEIECKLTENWAISTQFGGALYYDQLYVSTSIASIMINCLCQPLLPLLWSTVCVNLYHLYYDQLFVWAVFDLKRKSIVTYCCWLLAFLCCYWMQMSKLCWSTLCLCVVAIVLTCVVYWVIKVGFGVKCRACSYQCLFGVMSPLCPSLLNSWMVAIFCCMWVCFYC